MNDRLRIMKGTSAALLVAIVCIAVGVTGGRFAVGAPAAKGNDAGPRSLAARTAMKAYEADVSRAKEEYDRQVRSAQDKAIASLEKAKKAATVAADLDEANKVNALIDDLKQNQPANPRSLSSGLVGSWHISFGSGIQRSMTVAKDGTVTWQEDGKNMSPGKVLRNGSGGAGGDLLLELEGGKFDRITLVGDRLFDEHFNVAGSYPNGTPSNVGVGWREKARTN